MPLPWRQSRGEALGCIVSSTTGICSKESAIHRISNSTSNYQDMGYTHTHCIGYLDEKMTPNRQDLLGQLALLNKTKKTQHEHTLFLDLSSLSSDMEVGARPPVFHVRGTNWKCREGDKMSVLITLLPDINLRRWRHTRIRGEKKTNKQSLPGLWKQTSLCYYFDEKY